MSLVTVGDYTSYVDDVDADLIYDGSVRVSGKMPSSSIRLMAHRNCDGSALITFESLPIGVGTTYSYALPNINFGMPDTVILPVSLSYASTSSTNDTTIDTAITGKYDVSLLHYDPLVFKQYSLYRCAGNYPNLLRKAVGVGTRLAFKVLKEIQYCHLRISDTLNNYQNWGLGRGPKWNNNIPGYCSDGIAGSRSTSSTTYSMIGPYNLDDGQTGVNLRTNVEYNAISGDSAMAGLFYSDIQLGLYKHSNGNTSYVSPGLISGAGPFDTVTYVLRTPQHSSIVSGKITIYLFPYDVKTDPDTGLRTVTVSLIGSRVSGSHDVNYSKLTKNISNSSSYKVVVEFDGKVVKSTKDPVFEEVWMKIFDDPLNNIDSKGKWICPAFNRYVTKDDVKISDVSELSGCIQEILGDSYLYAESTGGTLTLVEGVDFGEGAAVPRVASISTSYSKGHYHGYSQVTLAPSGHAPVLQYWTNVSVDLVQQQYDAATGHWGGIYRPVPYSTPSYKGTGEDVW